MAREEKAHVYAEGAGGIMKIRLRDLKVECSCGLNVLRRAQF